MRTIAAAVGIGFAALGVGALATLADGDAPKTPGIARVSRHAKAPAFTPEREAAALTFVRRHHPELAELLEQLKPMNREGYEQAIGELFQVSESLAELKGRDERRHALGLEAWKARSRVELLAARAAAGPSAPRLASELRSALEIQVDVQIRQLHLDEELAEARLRKVRENLARLESRRDGLVESRLEAFLKKGQRARRRDEGTSAPGRAAPTTNDKGGRPK